MQRINNIANTGRHPFYNIFPSIKKEENACKLQHFLKYSRDMICIIDSKGYFREVSSSFEDILGYSKQELLSRPSHYFVIDGDQYTTDNEVEYLKNGVIGSYENRYRCKDGSIKCLDWRASAPNEDNLIYAIARDITHQKEEGQKIKLHSEQLEFFRKEGLESLRYARLLQEAILQDPENINTIFPQAFIYNAPKNIVSGDFYWFEKKGDSIMVAGADCTGHGMPGALLTILGMTKLHQITGSTTVTSPSKILNRLNEAIYNALGKKNRKKEMNDGMDMGLFSINLNSNKLLYAGANNPLYIVRDKTLIKIKADRQGVGALLSGTFENKTFDVRTGDMLYVFTDGFVDQFGGNFNKKYGFKRLSELLISIQEFSAVEQKEILINTIEKWKEDMEQTDDILVIGIRI